MPWRNNDVKIEMKKMEEFIRRKSKAVNQSGDITNANSTRAVSVDETVKRYARTPEIKKRNLLDQDEMSTADKTPKVALMLAKNKEVEMKHELA